MIVIANHTGTLDQKQLNKILFDIKEALLNHELERRLLKKAYNITVECIENCMKHSMDDNVEFSLILDNNKVIVETKNTINSNEVNELKNLLELVNSLDQEARIELFVEKLRNSTISDRGGAGLGIVDMAIKSKNNLNFEFITNDENNSTFKLKITIN